MIILQYHLVAPFWYQGAIIPWALDTHNISKLNGTYSYSYSYSYSCDSVRMGDGYQKILDCCANLKQCYIFGILHEVWIFTTFFSYFPPCFSSLWGLIVEWHKALLLQHFMVHFNEEDASVCCSAPLLALHQFFKALGEKL